MNPISNKIIVFSAAAKDAGSFSDSEKAAMQQRTKELKAEAKLSKDKAAGEEAVLKAIADLEEPDRGMAKKVYDLIKANAPELWAKTWYGMPAFANKDGEVICFFQNAKKFNARYQTLGFSDKARLDDGEFWPSAYALTEISPAVEKQLIALIKRAVA